MAVHALHFFSLSVTGGGDNLGGSLLLNIDDLREESQEGGDGSDEDEEGDEWEGEVRGACV